jgi:hypothetical protein
MRFLYLAVRTLYWLVRVRSIDTPIIMAVSRSFIVTGAELHRFGHEFQERVCSHRT